MKIYTTLLLMMYSLNAAAGISTSKLDELSYKLSTTSERPLEVCGYDSNEKVRCESFRGIFLYTSQSRLSYYKSLSLEDGNITVDDSIFAEVTDDSNVELDAEVTCELKLSKYRYTLKERLNAFAAGFLVKNKDSLNLYCEIK